MKFANKPGQTNIECEQKTFKSSRITGNKDKLSMKKQEVVNIEKKKWVDKYLKKNELWMT